MNLQGNGGKNPHVWTKPEGDPGQVWQERSPGSRARLTLGWQSHRAPASQVLSYGPGCARFSVDLVRPRGPTVKATQMHPWGTGTQEANLSSPNSVHPTGPKGPHFGPSHSFSLTPNSFLCFPPRQLLLDSSCMSWLCCSPRWGLRIDHILHS